MLRIAEKGETASLPVILGEVIKQNGEDGVQIASELAFKKGPKGNTIYTELTDRNQLPTIRRLNEAGISDPSVVAVEVAPPVSVDPVVEAIKLGRQETEKLRSYLANPPLKIDPLVINDAIRSGASLFARAHDTGEPLVQVLAQKNDSRILLSALEIVQEVNGREGLEDLVALTDRKGLNLVQKLDKIDTYESKKVLAALAAVPASEVVNDQPVADAPVAADEAKKKSGPIQFGLDVDALRDAKPLQKEPVLVLPHDAQTEYDDAAVRARQATSALRVY